MSPLDLLLYLLAIAAGLIPICIVLGLFFQVVYAHAVRDREYARAAPMAGARLKVTK